MVEPPFVLLLSRPHNEEEHVTSSVHQRCIRGGASEEVHQRRVEAVSIVSTTVFVVSNLKESGPETLQQGGVIPNLPRALKTPPFPKVLHVLEVVGVAFVAMVSLDSLSEWGSCTRLLQLRHHLPGISPEPRGFLLKVLHVFTGIVGVVRTKV